MDFPKYKSIIFEQNMINVNITNCDDDDVLLYIDSKNLIPTCEKPKCDCKNYVLNNTICIKGDNLKNINNEKYNKCVCVSGYTGETCKDIIYYNTKYYIFFVLKNLHYLKIK